MIDWDLFAERVQAGTRVVYLNPDGSVALDGILLENYPHKRDELMASTEKPDTREILSKSDFLRYQPITKEGDYLFHLGPGARYFIDGRWVTFEDLMRP